LEVPERFAAPVAEIRDIQTSRSRLFRLRPTSLYGEITNKTIADLKAGGPLIS
jgi:hypothetical protein